MSPTRWIKRPAREGDIGAALELFVRGGFQRQTEAQYRWRLLTVPCPVPTAWVAEDDGRIVGHYGGTPLRMRLLGRPTPAIHGSHAMTETGYRRQGILTALAGAAQEGWARAGYRLQIGVPWGTWGSRRAALGWVTLFRMVWVRRWICPERVLARKLRLPATVTRAAASARLWDRLVSDPLGRVRSDVSVRELREPEPALDRLWGRAETAWDHLVIRDREWVTWRYLAAPGLRYRVLLAERRDEPAGYLAFRIDHAANGGIRAYIADLFGPPDEADARRALLQAALAVFRSERVEAALALVGEGLAHREMVAAGFRASGGGDFAIVPLDHDLPISLLADPERWYVMGGDFDVI